MPPGKRRRQATGQGRPARRGQAAERQGTVISVHGGWIRVRDEQGRLRRLRPRRHLPPLASGDRVGWRAEAGSGHIETLHERRSLLARPDAGGAPRPIAANLDQVLVVVAPRPPMPPGLLDRYLVNVELQQLQAVIVLNKTDLVDAGDAAALALAARLSCYSQMGYPVLRCSSHGGQGLDALREQLHGRASIMVGVSGAGKSSLAAQLVPDAAIAIGDLGAGDAHGRHTTSSARLLELPFGGQLVDSPGVRDFATWHIDSRALAGAFPEFRALLGSCRFRDCRHEHDAGCAIREAVQAGVLDADRYHSYLLMLADSEAAERTRLERGTAT